MELTPLPNALVDILNVSFVRNGDDVKKAEWAIVNRSEYRSIVTKYKQHWQDFVDVSICKGDFACSRFSDGEVYDRITLCALKVEGSDNAIIALEGYASRIANAGRQQEAVDKSYYVNFKKHATNVTVAANISFLIYLTCPSLSIMITKSSSWILCKPCFLILKICIYSLQAFYATKRQPASATHTISYIRCEALCVAAWAIFLANWNRRIASVRLLTTC